jgi:Tol biopolymer transport system component
VVLGGCGFHHSGPDGDAGGLAGSADCFSRWFDGAPGLALSPPEPLAATASTVDDRDPWISADGLRLYFGRTPGAHGNTDIYAAMRSSPAQDFGSPGPVDNLDTTASESRAAVNGDDTLLVLSSNRGATGKFQIYVSARPDATQPFPSPSAPDQALVASVNAAADNNFDPFLSRDGLRLYFAPAATGAPQQIAVAIRAAGQVFGPAAALPGINSTSGDADPALSPDERVLVFTSNRPAGTGLGATNLWYATRQRATDDFTAPQPIPGVNGNADDGDPVLSADGCELYFASTRVDGRHQLFRARVTQ